MWDARYSEDELAYGDQPNDFLKEQVGALAKGDCLCIAEGQGRNAAWLAAQGFAVTAMDQSAAGMQRAQDFARAQGQEIATEVADLATYDLGENRWDAIVAIFAHLPPALRADVHRRIVTALKPGGTVLIEAYTPDKYAMPGHGGPPESQRDWTMTKDLLLGEFAGLEPVIAREVEREVNEGKHHWGLSATVQFLASKPMGGQN